ncbi:hypothetical protein Zmor_005995 [Zophobas morio]|uniref:Uncharacterized protein n=1 Tax=Zophobas morio TaxID=2755281 RepID=A0AA38IQX8_9CUCU|nr:hypothetical protein Zmor_005995 [Zophobas morio]
MMEQHHETDFTEQGLGTPVPVGSEVPEQASPDRHPASAQQPTQEVISQASGLVNATGSTSTPRKKILCKVTTSPPEVWGGTPTRVSIGSLEGRGREPLTPSNVSYVDLTWDEDSKRSKSVKRPRTDEDSPQVERVAVVGSSVAKQEKILSLFRKLDKNIKKPKEGGGK